MEKRNLFKWKHYHHDIILQTVRWYLRYNLSFRDLVEMMAERGLSVAHTTIMRWKMKSTIEAKVLFTYGYLGLNRQRFGIDNKKGQHFHLPRIRSGFFYTGKLLGKTSN